MATHNATAVNVPNDPNRFPSAEKVVRDPNSEAARVAREVAYVETFHGLYGGKFGPVELHTGPEDRLLRRLAQARSMLQMTVGILGEGFAKANDQHRENYLWAACDLVEAALADALLVTGLDREPTPGRGAILGP